MTATPRLPSSREVRVRLAAGLTVTALVAALIIAFGATALSTWQATPSEPLVGTARIDNDIVVIIADEGDRAAATARAETLRWSLVTLGLAIVPTAAIAWAVAGRMLVTVDTALDEAEATEQDRTRRLQEVVHELRTPLAVMGTNLELAASGADRDAESAVFIDAARRAIDRMDRTVDDLAGQGGLTVDATHGGVDVASVATDVVGEYVGPARQRGLHLVTKGSARVVAESAERAPLRTVVGNLVANAVRLAPSGSIITVAWGDTPEWVWISVIDEGPGLPDRHHARVFERGWQGPHERHRSDGEGAGLGLTIARQLAEAQGGTVTLASEESAGSTFTVWLPRTADADRFDVVATDGIHPITMPWTTTPIAAS